MEYKDYYSVLGLAKDATQDEVKQAYRKLARKFHPDLNNEPHAEERFKEISEANEVLGDPEKRAAYDQIGTGHQPGQDFRPPPDWDAGFEFSGGFADSAGDQGAEFSDFFETLFGQARRAGHEQSRSFGAKGQDHHARVLIDLEDSFTGTTRAIQLKVPKVTADGHLVTETKTLNVTIPKGVRAGQHIRLKQQGAPGLGNGAHGDLYLEVSFLPHRLYRADGSDLFLDLPVTPWEAVLGGKVKVPTPDGVVDLTIPENSRNGRKLRLKQRGIPGNPPGDLYIILQVVLPPANDDETRKFYETMAEKLSFNPRSNLGV